MKKSKVPVQFSGREEFKRSYFAAGDAMGLTMSYGKPMKFLTRPIAATFLCLTLLLLISPDLVKKFLTKGRR